MSNFHYDPKLAADILMHDCPELTKKQADAIANLTSVLERRNRQSSSAKPATHRKNNEL